MRQSLLKLALCFGVVLLQVGFLQADEIDPTIELKAKSIFEDVFSPFCPGRSLNDCPSSNAHELKDQIRADLKAGKEPEAILQSIFSQYGEQYRALPKASGMGMLAWALPCAFLAIGTLVILFVTKKKPIAISSSEKPPSVSNIDDKTAKEIEKALAGDS